MLYSWYFPGQTQEAVVMPDEINNRKITSLLPAGGGGHFFGDKHHRHAGGT